MGEAKRKSILLNPTAGMVGLGKPGMKPEIERTQILHDAIIDEIIAAELHPLVVQVVLADVASVALLMSQPYKIADAVREGESLAKMIIRSLEKRWGSDMHKRILAAAKDEKTN
jgi:hypothetical protein